MMYFKALLVSLSTVLMLHGQTVKREVGESFVFGVQGDSHPERSGKMFSADLYRVNMQNVVANNPDFYFLLGDDSGIDRLIERGDVSKFEIDQVYQYQKSFTDLLHCPVYRVIGNHEQIAKYILNGESDNAAVYAAQAMKKYFPVPDSFSGNRESVKHVGVLKDYYCFEHGNALFVVIDPYWHSEAPVDNVPGEKQRGGNNLRESQKNEQLKDKESKKGVANRSKNSWSATLGKDQYEWLKQTLSVSNAKYKFVFAHHVNGSGRGGIECATFYEWGGHSRNGEWEFSKMRPDWEMPIHQLFVKYGVNIFFQGHDHLFCKQELDGVVYQSCPNPADNTYTAFNATAYKSGDILPNSGFVR
ncbi:MAG: metallophosphoesterase family protein, partial [Tannerellaceae bacterium]